MINFYPWAKRLSIVVLTLLVLLIIGLFYRSCQPIKKPQDEYGNSTIDTRRERHSRVALEDSLRATQQHKQTTADSLYNATRSKKPTPVTAAAVRRADSLIRANLR